jgi:hypothetical protein
MKDLSPFYPNFAPFAMAAAAPAHERPKMLLGSEEIYRLAAELLAYEKPEPVYNTIEANASSEEEIDRRLDQIFG